MTSCATAGITDRNRPAHRGATTGRCPIDAPDCPHFGPNWLRAFLPSPGRPSG
jgi:hypothetical protein